MAHRNEGACYGLQEANRSKADFTALTEQYRNHPDIPDICLQGMRRNHELIAACERQGCENGMNSHPVAVSRTCPMELSIEENIRETHDTIRRYIDALEAERSPQECPFGIGALNIALGWEQKVENAAAPQSGIYADGVQQLRSLVAACERCDATATVRGAIEPGIFPCPEAARLNDIKRETMERLRDAAAQPRRRQTPEEAPPQPGLKPFGISASEHCGNAERFIRFCTRIITNPDSNQRMKHAASVTLSQGLGAVRDCENCVITNPREANVNMRIGAAACSTGELLGEIITKRLGPGFVRRQDKDPDADA